MVLLTFVPLSASALTAATRTGIISGFSLMIMGFVTSSGQNPLIWSRLSRISIVAESILAVCSNSSMTVEAFSLDIDMMFLILLTVAIVCSTGFVTTSSICSGLAPGYVVITMA